jgi:hypothetical protein
MGKKHHNIKVDDNKKYGVTETTRLKTRLYLKNSRDPETPIYVSYTPKYIHVAEDISHSSWNQSLHRQELFSLLGEVTSF